MDAGAHAHVDAVRPRALGERALQLDRRLEGGGCLLEHGEELVSTRVDLVPGEDGAPLLLELEVAEPALYLATAPGAAERFAAAIRAC